VRGGSRFLLAIVAVSSILAGCSLEPPDSPTTAVRRALDAVVAHDLDRATAAVCRARRDAFSIGSLLPGLLNPVQALPGGDMTRTLGVIQFDASALSLTEHRTATTVGVRVRGDLVERFDPAQVEALFRAYAAENGERLDDAQLADTLRNVSFGDVRVPIDETVPVVLEDGSWRLCPPAPTP
jgi:hypothetical protein